MAITVNKVSYTTINVEKENRKLFKLTWPATIDVLYTKNSKQYVLKLNLAKDFRTDGASIPPIFNWFLPRWDNKNMMYNCGSIVHDCLYTYAGIDNYFTRSEADDFIRGIWRCSGISRFKASLADVCLAIFAGGDEHWGDDDLDNKKNNLIKFDIIPV